MLEEKKGPRSFDELALKYAEQYEGKVEIVPKVPIRGLEDFSVYYTPGVAAVSKAISKNPDLSFNLTGRWNTIAIITNGTRVLGLGNIGPEASMPVMEGKALLFKFLGGVDAVPLPIRVYDRDEFVDIVKKLEPSFGGVNLEDISSPECFYILDRLGKESTIPIWHDDQLGTAGVSLAGLYNALKLTGREIAQSKIVLFGAGAANIATARVLISAGAKNIVLIDSKGALHPEREDMDELMLKNPWKYDLAIRTNPERIKGGLPEALKGSDVLIAASRPGPGVIRKEWIRGMSKNAIVFSLANPVPEIWPHEAKEAGAKVVATGRSDFPNQVNNSVLFPAVFRGVLDARATTINDEMMISAAKELASYSERRGLREDYIIPKMDEWDVFPTVAARIATKAVEMGFARRKMSYEEFFETGKEIIGRTRSIAKALGMVK